MSVRVDTLKPGPESGQVRVAIVVSRYNEWITDRLRDGAVEELRRRLGDAGTATIIPAPGAWELGYLSACAAASGAFDAIVALGCLIKGETRHDEVIADALCPALMRLSVERRIPIGFGVLTVETAEQGEARAGGEARGGEGRWNKGAEAMGAALDALFCARAMR